MGEELDPDEVKYLYKTYANEALNFTDDGDDVPKVCKCDNCDHKYIYECNIGQNRCACCKRCVDLNRLFDHRRRQVHEMMDPDGPVRFG